jgi:hypothetical protein
MQPPANIVDIYKSQGWNDEAAINADIANGGWTSKVSGGGSSSASTTSDGRLIGGIDPSQIPNITSYIQSQFPAENSALQNIVDVMKARANPLDLYNQYETEAGLPQLRNTATSLSKEIGGIEDTLSNIEPNIAARTRESLVTQSQKEGMVSTQKTPWLDKLTKLASSLTGVGNQISLGEAGVNTKVGYAVQGQNQDIEPLTLVYQALVDRDARLTTGFTADSQNTLNALYDKLNRERTLSDQDWALANSLAADESSYLKTLQTTAASAGYKVTGSESTDDLLGIIGTTAAEQIAYSRSQANKPSETSKSKATSLTALRNDLAQGTTFEDAIRRYSDIIPTYQIRQEYNAKNYYGKPATESENQVQQWSLTPKAATSGLTVNPDGSITIQ